MGNLLLMITALIAAFVLHKCIALASNYHRARRTGFPVIVSPAPSQNPVWLVISIVWLPYLKRFLTAKLYDHFDVAVHGWEFRQNGALHRRLGRTFALVTPDECSLWLVGYPLWVTGRCLDMELTMEQVCGPGPGKDHSE